MKGREMREYMEAHRLTMRLQDIEKELEIVKAAKPRHHADEDLITLATGQLASWINVGQASLGNTKKEFPGLDLTVCPPQCNGKHGHVLGGYTQLMRLHGLLQ